MSDTITIYEKPTCTTCRKTVKLLEEQGVKFDRINYFVDRISMPVLRTLLKKMEMRPIDLFRRKEQKFKDLGIATKDLSDEDLMRILVENPELVERPIVVRGDRAVLARPAEKVQELF